MLYALTGATGFIGQALALRLRARYLPVRILVRDPERARPLIDAGCEPVHGDLSDPSALDALCHGAQRIFHCAGAVRGACAGDFERVNTEGTVRLLQTLTALNAKHAKQVTGDGTEEKDQAPRLLVLSSLAAREPHLSWYAHSKAQAEQQLSTARAPFAWVILRPPAVYGPGDRELLPLFRSMRNGIAPLPGNPSARVSLLHVEDLVDAMLSCIEQPLCAGHVLELHDGREGGYSWREVAAIASEVWGRRVRLLPIPRALLDTVATLNLAQARRSGRLPMLTPAKLRELRHTDWSTSNTLISQLTDWQPQWSLAAGLAALPLDAAGAGNADG